MTKRLDPARDDARVWLRTARLQRGVTQIALAEMAYVSSLFISMVETGEREPTRVCDIVVLVGILRVSPLYLSDGRLDASLTAQRPARTAPFPADCDPRTLAHHQQLVRQFIHLARRDGRAAGEWLRRLAREPSVHPWLVLDQLATRLGDEPTMTRMPSPARSPDRWFTVGARLRQLRHQHGLSAAELAGKAGVGPSTVSRLERQARPSCRTRTAARLAAALGRSPGALTCSQPSPGHATR